MCPTAPSCCPAPLNKEQHRKWFVFSLILNALADRHFKYNPFDLKPWCQFQKHFVACDILL